MRDDLGNLLAPWDFELPEAQIAREPAAVRDQSRLYLLGDDPDPFGPPWGAFHQVVGVLRPGDLLVLNDVAVFKARLRAFRQSGGAVEVMITGPATGGFHAFVRPGRRLHEGERLRCGPGEIELLTREADGTWIVRLEPDIDTLAMAAGEVPLPPYLDREPTAADVERYQTVYARAGDLRASAAPTAGLHFTPELLTRIGSDDVHIHGVTLEVGAGTFQPLDATAWESGKLHTERYVVPEATFEAVTAARAEGRRVVAVGTTTLRVLESMTGPGPGSTDLFIRPGYAFKHVDALITNFHLPRSSLLMLVTAFGGLDRVMAAYRHAVDSGFRFYSYGDAMWVERAELALSRRSTIQTSGGSISAHTAETVATAPIPSRR